MNNFSKRVLVLLFLAIIMSVFQITYYGLSYQDKDLIALKQTAISVTQLPDLSLVTEATWIRHASLSTPFAIFQDDGSLLDYYPATFVYHVKPIKRSHRQY
jgi:hypothetical protein